MPKHYLPIGLTCAALIAVLAFASSWLTAPQEVPNKPFPETVSERVFLPDQEIGEVSREVKFASDGFTKICARVYFPDGGKGYIKFRPDGSVVKFATYFAAAEGTPVGPVDPLKCDLRLHDSPILEIEGAYAADGERLLFEKRYFADGSLKRSGERIEDGNYLVNEYQQGGVKLAATRVFDKDGQAYSTVEFHANGKTKLLVKKPDDYATETTEYAESGLKSSYHFVKFNHVIWEKYQADGETLVYRFEQKPNGQMYSTSYEMFAWYYNEDGTLNHERKFTRYNMNVTYRGADGEPDYIQVWRYKTPNRDDMTYEPDQWVLEAIFLDGDIVSAESSVWFAKDEAMTVERHVYPYDVGHGIFKKEIKTYHPDGSLATIVTPAKKGKSTTVKFEPGENPERFDPAILGDKMKTADYLVPPQIVPETESYM